MKMFYEKDADVELIKNKKKLQFLDMEAKDTHMLWI